VLAGTSGDAWCYELHAVEWVRSFLSVDGLSMVCWFRGPDAESVRIALRKSHCGLPSHWIGTVEGLEPDVKANVLVARTFQEPVSIDSVLAREAASAWCLEAHGVRPGGSFFSRDRRRMLCLYEAPDAESVRIAQRLAEMPVDAVWAVRCIEPAARSA
jgi:hypothetical protein